MKILAIETSSTACSAALLIDDEIKSIHEIAPMQQSKKILPMIDELLQHNFLSLNQLDAIAFGCGPGSFTGVRIATSIAQGLGYALNLPLIPISSLAALAQDAYDEFGWKNVLVAIDARVKEVYWGAYRVNQLGLVELISKERVSIPENVIMEDSIWYGVGSAWEIYAKQIPYQPVEKESSLLATATGVLKLAKYKAIDREWIKAEQAMPVYLRDKVAKKEEK